MNVIAKRDLQVKQQTSAEKQKHFPALLQPTLNNHTKIPRYYSQMALVMFRSTDVYCPKGTLVHIKKLDF